MSIGSEHRINTTHVRLHKEMRSDARILQRTVISLWRTEWLILMSAVMLGLPACTSPKTQNVSQMPAEQTPKQFVCKQSPSVKVDYLLFFPKGYEEKSD